MAKFILHGGETKKQCESNTKFFGAMAENITDKGMVLYVPFSCERDVWEEKFMSFVEKLGESEALPDDMNFECAVPSKFLEQLSRADVVYFHGGSTKRLIETMNAIDGAVVALEKYNGVRAGSSAGANMLCEYAYDYGQLEKGFGLVDKKVLVHADVEEYQSGLDVLKKAGDESMEIIYLPETEFVTITQ